MRVLTHIHTFHLQVYTYTHTHTHAFHLWVWTHTHPFTYECTHARTHTHQSLRVNRPCIFGFRRENKNKSVCIYLYTIPTCKKLRLNGTISSTCQRESACVCVCVRERERERERMSGGGKRGGKGATNRRDPQVTCPIFIPPSLIYTRLLTHTYTHTHSSFSKPAPFVS